MVTQTHVMNRAIFTKLKIHITICVPAHYCPLSSSNFNHMATLLADFVGKIMLDCSVPFYIISSMRKRLESV